MARNEDYGAWKYEEGLYFLEGVGLGLTFEEVLAVEDGVEEHEARKRARLAKMQEY